MARAKSPPPSIAGVRCFERAFTTHAEQWNFGLDSTSISTEWVLALDADFVVSDALVDELKQLQTRRRCQRLRGVVHLLHRRPAAARRRVSAGRGVVSSLRAHGTRRTGTRSGSVWTASIKKLTNRIFHDDRKPLSQWLASQVAIHAPRSREALQHAAVGVDAGRSCPAAHRRGAAGDVLLLPHWQGGILDGWAGLVLRAAARRGGTDPVVVSWSSAGCAG